jgi:hypothetical protein
MNADLLEIPDYLQPVKEDEEIIFKHMHDKLFDHY